MMIFAYTLTIIAGYLIGSMNSAIIVGKLIKKVDIRTVGSGNAGATNTLRTLGIGPALLVILGDILKGVLAVLLGKLLVGSGTGEMLGGLFAVLGHNWPVYFGFKGGKGILTSAIVILMISPKIGLAVIIFALVIIAITRYVSLGSILGAILYPIMVIVIENGNIPLIVFSLAIAVLAVLRHRGNIERLREGTESKIGKKNK